MIYLDHNATTPLSTPAKQAMVRAFDTWGNPHSFHSAGLEAARLLKQAENRILEHINGHNGRIIWTASGSEANRLLIQTVCKGSGDLLTSGREHKSIECIRRRYGNITTSIANQIHEPSTILMSFILVNNETGVIADHQLIRDKAKSHRTILHFDAVQALGKRALDVEDLGADALTLSAHKIYGPKGIGCLWIRKGTTIQPNGIELGLLDFPYTGTPNVLGIVGFGEAVINLNIDEYRDELEKKEERFLGELRASDTKFQLNTNEERIPGTLSIAFEGINNVELVLLLSDKDVMVATGSACSSGKKASHVLEDMGLPKEQIESTIRISLGKVCSFTDIFNGVQIISETIKELQNGL